ncbi:MAG: hypothetical protein SCK29_00970 [Bacillota bacterium]|nr:hypothetical protein [Bacillota bacterium]MDW7682672.1 hypothetical protein [Bacillota bacterium]
MHRKVAILNLEQDMPTVEQAMYKLKNALSTSKRQGSKAVIVIHGYGSSGVGGGIKAAVGKQLRDRSLQGVVRAYVGGEQWPERKRELLGMCKALENHERQVAENSGVTVVILR